MRRFYSTFPDGLPGVGLLLLRSAVGLRLMIHALAWATASQALSVGMWALGLLAFLIGASLLAGLFTRLAGVLTVLAAVVPHFWYPAWDHSLASLLNFNVVVIATALSLLGPGAFSLDAHFFGRRKIIIPRVANS